ncbi:MAG: response regulator [Thermodesulfobacteriota bacterium]|nr:response regulator [Thermodesulfobacteriota bacterium]
MKNEVFTIPEAAKYCAISRVTLWKYVKSGDLKASLTPGGHYRVAKKDLETFIFEKGMFPLGNALSSDNRVLIVDDDHTIQRLFSNILKERKFETETASDGFEAGMKIMTFKPDLIVLDLFMPGMDGFEVCKLIRKNPATTHIKVLAITGHDTAEDRKRIIHAGAEGYLVKPVAKETLVEHVEGLLGHSRIGQIGRS